MLSSLHYNSNWNEKLRTREGMKNGTEDAAIHVSYYHLFWKVWEGSERSLGKYR